jgi:hypothetical protein
MPRINASTALLAVTLAASAAAQNAVRQPMVKAGPYRIAVDRITQNRTLTLKYETGDRSNSGVTSQRTIQLQVAVFGETEAANAGLATFQIKSVVVDRNGRSEELPHYGGPLENPNDPALVRGYLYVPAMPPSVAEIRSLEGEIVSYEHTGPFEMDVPITNSVPSTVEKDGVKVTLRDWSQDGAIARLTLVVDAPASSLVVNTVNDGSYGVTLVNKDGHPALLGAGSMIQPRPNQAEYRMAYNSLQGTPDHLRLRFLHRAGPRKVYPFKVEHIQIPPHPGRS